MKKTFKYFVNKRDLLLMWIYPIVIFLLMQSFNFKPLTDMKAPTLLLNFLLFEILMLLLFSIFGRLNFALRFLAVL